ncbi:hypothetical protein B1218_36735, partial [Pseudomonas ogarae]
IVRRVEWQACRDGGGGIMGGAAGPGAWGAGRAEGQVVAVMEPEGGRVEWCHGAGVGGWRGGGEEEGEAGREGEGSGAIAVSKATAVECSRRRVLGN